MGRLFFLTAMLSAVTAGHTRAAQFEEDVTMPSILTDMPVADHDGLPAPGLSRSPTIGVGTPANPPYADGAYASDAGEGVLPPGATQGCAGGACGAWCGGCGNCGGADACTHACYDSPGLCQFFQKLHDKGDACWVGRADALVLWRSAPPGRALVETGLGGVPVLNADEMDSPAAGGPRFSLFRFNRCNGTGVEATYFQAANWRSERPLSAQSQLYALAPPGIYGNDNTYNFDTGYANLGSSVRSFELNRHWCKGEHLRFLAGFRWVEWQETFSLSDEFDATPPITDYYETDCINDLYGGQIGLDAWLLTLPWMRIDSVIKAGAYYNNAVQTSMYKSNVLGGLDTQKVRVGESPVSCAFVGELGFTGVVPVCSWLDFRFGYFGLWLSGIVQPTQQLSGQVLTQPSGGTEPTSGSIDADGGVLVQGVSLGLEGRW